jgi:hypothetical protein
MSMSTATTSPATRTAVIRGSRGGGAVRRFGRWRRVLIATAIYMALGFAPAHRDARARRPRRHTLTTGVSPGPLP